MKTQHQHKTIAAKQILFSIKKNTEQLQSSNDVITFDEEAGFDTHWNYSYIMDYIWTHQKVKKRKS